MIVGEMKLLPCPAGHDRAKLDYDDEFEAHIVLCDQEGCNWRTWGDTEAESIAAWNTRADSDVIGKLVDALNRALNWIDADDCSQMGPAQDAAHTRLIRYIEQTLSLAGGATNSKAGSRGGQ